MSDRPFYDRYRKFAANQYPAADPDLRRPGFENALFPEIVFVPAKILPIIQKAVAAAEHLKQAPFGETPKDLERRKAVFLNHPQDSVLMSFDFHLSAEGLPLLIEVNTNSSGFLLTNSLCQYHGLEHRTALKNLEFSFQEEWRKFQIFARQKTGGRGLKPGPPQRTAVIDEAPFGQKMIFEFQMFKDFFKSFGQTADIYDVRSLNEDENGFLRDEQGRKIDFCYNRSTDFYFSENPHLKRAYQKGLCAFSPHPSEHFLLADKNRLSEPRLYKEERFAPLAAVLLKTQKLTENTKDQAWANKKKYVFKPAGKFGGKGVFRGKSLTAKTFQALCKEGDIIFQTFAKAPLWRDSAGVQWKFDLRVFSYKGEVQQMAARCYQGQTTNFRSLGGGFAPAVPTEDSGKLTPLTLPAL